MKELHIIIGFWKKAAKSHGKDKASHMVDAWLTYYLSTGINLASR